MTNEQINVCLEIGDERKRQQELWGNDFDDKNTPNDWVAYITMYASDAAYHGTLGGFNVDHYREQLIKAAALCCAAVETLDRNGGKITPRHYDKLNEGEEDGNCKE